MKNRTIDKFTALMWYLAGINFGRFVRNKTIDFLFGKHVTSPAIIKDIHASACMYAPLGIRQKLRTYCEEQDYQEIDSNYVVSCG